LAGSLIGPAGFGLAIAAISSAITFAIQGFSSWTRSIKGAKEESDKLAQSVAAELVNLASLVGLAQNVNASQQDRQKALSALNQEYGKYLPNLEKEGITLNNLNDAYAKITETLLNQAVVKGLQEEIGKEVQKVAEQIIKVQQLREKDRLGLNQQKASTFSVITAEDKLAAAINQKNKATSDGFIAQRQQELSTKGLIGTTDTYGQIITNLKNELQATLQPLFNLTNQFTDLNVELKKTKEIKTGKLDFSQFLQQQEIEIPLRFSDDPVEIEKSITPVAAEIQNQMRAYFQRAEPLDASLLLAIDEQKLKKFSFMNFEGLTEAQKNLADTGALIANTITPSLEAMIQAIGRGENAFQAFGQGVKAILVQVIQKLAATAILAGILSALFPGGLGGAQGFAQIFGRLAGFRATGGPVSGGSPYVVGERGPELFVPAVSGSIVPNNAVGSFMSGRQSGGSGMSVLRGQDILLAYARTQRSQLRVNG
jgi:phage-related minor tail protein